jgi:hypothetical protein
MFACVIQFVLVFFAVVAPSIVFANETGRAPCPVPPLEDNKPRVLNKACCLGCLETPPEVKGATWHCHKCEPRLDLFCWRINFSPWDKEAHLCLTCFGMLMYPVTLVSKFTYECAACERVGKESATL